MTKPTELKTERLLLRPFRLSDTDDVLEYGSDPEWAAFSPRPYTRSDAEKVVAKAVLKSWDEEAVFAIVLEARVVGLIVLDVDTKHRRAELGYEVARDVWGQGLATEAAIAVCDWGFHEYGLAKVHAGADPRNERSLRVMEKLGMRREGIHRSHDVERGERVDAACYAVLRDEWRGPHGPVPPVPVEEHDTSGRSTCTELTTPRLLLRPLGPGDVDDLFEYSKDPEWAEHLIASRPQPYTRRDAEEWIARRIVESPDEEPSWAIVLDGTCIGNIRLTTDPGHATGEVHYGLAKAHWGRGFMPEAATAVVDWGFRQMGLQKISARTYTPNRQSRRVMEKLGMRREGVSRSHHKDPRPGRPRIDFVYYGLLREEWEQQEGTRSRDGPASRKA